jgi:ATP phosphoribosyltransferase
VPLFTRAGLDCASLEQDDRTLIRSSKDGQLRFLLLKPDDVPTYVEYGAAELGVSGRDTLLERAYDLYHPVDLQIGKCRMVVAGPIGQRIPVTPRVATKYPHIAKKHFAEKGLSPEIIYIQVSVELGPLVGLSDVIVDLVETGSTLQENRLEVIDVVCPISSVLIANRALFKLRHELVHSVVERIRAAVG